MPISRTFLFFDLHEKGFGLFACLELLSESVLKLCIEVLFASSAWIILPGRAASSRGLDGKSNGSMCLESNNSPSTWGGRTGSHVDLSSDLLNNISMLCWAEVVTEGVIEDTRLEMLAVSSAKEDLLPLLPSRSRPRSPIYKIVIVVYSWICVRKNLFF